jgi:hypothetical protein
MWGWLAYIQYIKSTPKLLTGDNNNQFLTKLKPHVMG